MHEKTYRQGVEISRGILNQDKELFRPPAEGFARYYKALSGDERAELLRDLIWCSEQIMVSWDAVNLIAQDLVLLEEPLPPEIRPWVKARLAGGCPRPTKRGKDPDKDHVRNRCIVDAVQWAVQNGFPEMRNHSRGSGASYKGGSACDAVGEAVSLSYVRIEQIWLESASADSATRRHVATVTGFDTSGSTPMAIVSYLNSGNK